MKKKECIGFYTKHFLFTTIFDNVRENFREVMRWFLLVWKFTLFDLQFFSNGDVEPQKMILFFEVRFQPLSNRRFLPSLMPFLPNLLIFRKNIFLDFLLNIFFYLGSFDVTYFWLPLGSIRRFGEVWPLSVCFHTGIFCKVKAVDIDVFGRVVQQPFVGTLSVYETIERWSTC